MTRVLFLLICLCLLTACSKEPAPQTANSGPNPNATVTATPVATPSAVATPVAGVTPTPESIVASAMNETAWQKDFGAVVPFVKRMVKAGLSPDRIITNQTVNWTVTFRKYAPGGPNAMTQHPLIDFAEADAGAKQKPWIQIVAEANDSELERLKALKAGQKIKLRCQMSGVTVTEKNDQKGASLEGVVLSAEGCVIE